MATNDPRSPLTFMISGLVTALVFISTMAFSIYVIVFRDLVLNKKKIILHARRHGIAEICLQLKRWHRNVIVISDLEGEVSAEYEY